MQNNEVIYTTQHAMDLQEVKMRHLGLMKLIFQFHLF